ncbi:MAG: hypothetical protein NZ700_11480 [Gemmataceae bacterium]|nr:hypothetical protein [Gemmataceae bacterium]MDW8265563.1 hypothetical protein [Gemmataceae bacterium]
MIATFERDGVRLRYPENWRLEREEGERGWTVSIQSPETAFILICFDDGMPSAEDMSASALAALREEYPDLEADDAVDTLAGQPAIGHDVRFFSFDLTNTCWIRSFYAAGGTVLVFWQANDLELGQNEPVLRAICASLEFDD